MSCCEVAQLSWRLISVVEKTSDEALTTITTHPPLVIMTNTQLLRVSQLPVKHWPFLQIAVRQPCVSLDDNTLLEDIQHLFSTLKHLFFSNKQIMTIYRKPRSHNSALLEMRSKEQGQCYFHLQFITLILQGQNPQSLPSVRIRMNPFDHLISCIIFKANVSAGDALV